MKNYPPKKVFILQNGNYNEITFSEYCHRAEKDDTYKKMLLLPIHGMLMEVTPMTYKKFYREDRRQKYLRKLSIENDDFSYDSLTTNEFNGEDILIDESDPVDEKAIQNLMIEKLRICLPLLNEREMNLIYALYYLNLSEYKIAKMYGVSQNAIHKRKKRILHKLKKILEN